MRFARVVNYSNIWKEVKHNLNDFMNECAIIDAFVNVFFRHIWSCATFGERLIVLFWAFYVIQVIFLDYFKIKYF